ARDLQKAQAEAVAPVTVTRVLSYAKAATMKDTLKKFLSARGDIFSDDRSNQLVIRDIPSVIPTLDNLIRQLDRKSQQVEIEARVIQATRSFSQDVGVQWGFAGTTTGGRSIFGGNPNVGVSPITTGTGLPAPPLIATPTSSTGGSSTPGLPFNVNLGAGVPTSGLYFGHRSPNFAVDLFISAAEAKGVGKLLSKPKVITQNNEKATVKQGTKIPIQTTINNTISVQYIDAVLKLEVTPQITAEGTVFMDVLVENTQIDNGIPRVQGIPALDTQSAETKVLVADGGTVVIGGIIVTQQQTQLNEVPIVGSLPVVGYLFRHKSVDITSSELLFFLTPRIIPG
ncbi:MAG TPA: secretin N-terminal domain-containing protein, partial [Candidatus Sulfotelmatobacter sp.]|nr:secretin N-terminal domain-containing protein [Candidatus Sulfotelmatobacter sp.]